MNWTSRKRRVNLETWNLWRPPGNLTGYEIYILPTITISVYRAIISVDIMYLMLGVSVRWLRRKELEI
jgi:hypothetical protein